MCNAINIAMFNEHHSLNRRCKRMSSKKSEIDEHLNRNWNEMLISSWWDRKKSRLCFCLKQTKIDASTQHHVAIFRFASFSIFHLKYSFFKTFTILIHFENHHDTQLNVKFFDCERKLIAWFVWARRSRTRKSVASCVKSRIERTSRWVFDSFYSQE